MYRKILIALLASSVCISTIADETLSSTYGSLVDDAGNISMPEKFSNDWTFLGSWSIAAEDVDASADASGHGAAALHNVYTQPSVVASFKENGKFPDGAVLIKELLKTQTASMTTGTVSRGVEVEGWFVMVKDTEGRFEGNPLWGDGWGWSLFSADNRKTTVSTNYKSDCLGCHIPARNEDWIYLSGYPALAD